MFEIHNNRKASLRSAGSAAARLALAAVVVTTLLPGAALAQKRTPLVPKVKDSSTAIQDYRRKTHLQNQVDYLYAIKAQQQKAKMPAATKLGPGKPKTSPGTRLVDIGQTSGKWVLRGPTRMTAPYPTGFNFLSFNPRSQGLPGSFIAGRANSIAIDPTSKNGLTAYLATAGGGVWKTIDGGNNWQPSGSNSFPIQATSSVAINPKNGLIVYVGLGDFNDTSNAFGAGTGIMRTTNGGSTWVNVGAAQMQGTAVSAIVVDPENPLIVTATCGRGTRVGAIYQSVDGGNTFKAVTGAPLATWNDIKIGARDAAGVRHYYATSPGDGVYRSVDRGVTWTKLSVPLVFSGGSSILEAAPSAIDPLSVTVLEASTANKDARAYKSNDRGNTWVKEITGNLLINSALGSNNWETATRAIVHRTFPAPQVNPALPSTEDLVFAGGRTISGSLAPIGERLWMDFGLVVGDNSALTHAEQQEVAQNPVQKNNFLLANDGGVYGFTYTSSGIPGVMGNWNFPNPAGQQLNATLTIAQFVTADFARDNPSRMMGGTLNNGVAKSEGAAPLNSTLSWAGISIVVPRKYFPNTAQGFRFQSFDDYGAAVAFNPNNSNSAYSYTPGGGNWPATRLYFTQDNWNSALDISPDQKLKDPANPGQDLDAKDANNASPLYIYPFSPLTSSSLASDWIADQRSALGVLTVGSNGSLYTGGQYLWRFDPNTVETLPSGPTAPAVADPANGRWKSKIGNTQFTTAGNISAITVAPGGGTIYVGTSDGQIWWSRNAGSFNTTTGASTATFERISGPSLPSRPVTSIVINTAPTNSGVPNADIIVSLGGIANGTEGHVYRAADATVGGGNVLFTKQDGLGTATLPNVAANAIDRDPDDPTNTWYVATDLGVFTTVNGGSSWSDASTPLGLPNVEVTALKVIKYAVDGTKRLNVATFGRGFYQFDLGNAAAVTVPATLLVTPSYSRAGGQVFVTLNVKNTGGTATNARVTAASLTVGTAVTAATTTLPLTLGTIGNNTNKTGTVAFPGAVGRLGTSAILKATITYTNAAGALQTFVYTSPRTRLP